MIKDYQKIDKIQMKKELAKMIEDFNFNKARVSCSYYSDMYSGHMKIIINMDKDFYAPNEL